MAARTAQEAHRLLAGRDATVAVAESVTGGLLGAALTETPGSSATFAGGVVAYATDLKRRLLDVPADLIADRGVVDPDVAAAMAVGVCRLIGTRYGVATTGVAGPDPQDGRPVGTVYIAVAEVADTAGPPAGADAASVEVEPLRPVPDERTPRGRIRALTVVRALDLLCGRLRRSGPAGPRDPGDARG